MWQTRGLNNEDGQLPETISYEQTGQQQPMSLLTVNRGGSRATTKMPDNQYEQQMQQQQLHQSDLLTLRILEASERKMQLIKQLLSPEEFNSLQEDLASRSIMFDSSSLPSSSVSYVEQQQQTSKSVPVAMNEGASETDHSETRRRNRLSRSEANLDYENQPDHVDGKGSGVNVDQQIKESLARRKEAHEFFFFSPAESSPATIVEKELAIELRNGHYLSSKRNDQLEAGKQVLREAPERWQDGVRNRLAGLLSMFGLPDRIIRGSSKQEEEGALVSDFLHDPLSRLATPFATNQNLVTICERLRADGNQQDRMEVPILSSASQTISNMATDSDDWQLYLMDIRSDTSLSWSGRLKKRHSSSSKSRPLLLAGTRSMAAKNWLGRDDLLLHNTCVERMLFLDEPNDERRIIEVPPFESSLETEQRHQDNSKMIHLQLEKLRWFDAESMSPEEKRSAKLLTLYEKCENLRENLRSVRISILKILQQHRQLATTADLRVLRNSLDWWHRTRQKLLAAQRDLASGCAELESTREDQQGSLSIRMLDPSSIADAGAEPDIIFELERLADQLSGDEMETLASSISKLVGWRYGSSKLLELVRQPDGSAPAKDTQRRRSRFLSWLGGLQLELVVGGSFRKLIPLQELLASQQDSPDPIYCFDDMQKTAAGNLWLSLANRNACSPSHIAVKCELQAKSNLLGYRKVIAKGGSRIRLSHSSDLLRVQIQAAEDDGENQRVVCHLTLRCSLEEHNTGSRQRRLVELLHEGLFDYPSAAAPELSIQMKCHQLLNSIDLNLLSALLSRLEQSAAPDGTKRARQKCLLDPFADRLSPESSRADGISRFRRLLLSWRWAHSIASTTSPQSDRRTPVVYLSDLENQNAFKVSKIEAQTTKLSKRMENIGKFNNNSGDLAAQSSLSGFKLIEQIRREAGEYLKSYELLVREKLRLHSRRLNPALDRSSAQKGIRLSSQANGDSSAQRNKILLEPKLHWIHLPRLACSIRHFIPRPRTAARRPLMPQRRQASKRLAEIISQEFLSISAGANHERNDSTNESDLESRVVSHWHRFASLQKRQQSTQAAGSAGATATTLERPSADALQLLVTIQQASNLPMRIVYVGGGQSTLSRATRSSSPLSPSPAFNMQQQQQQQQQQPILQLAAPTSYVELVFQQKQQATSLAQGKNPSWNETLFFQVEQPQPSEHPAAAQSLLSEYLELNLYDYFLSLVDDYSAPSSMGDSSATLQLLSGQSANQSLSSRRQQQTSRLERHLLGSLRVPLSTLLHNGRIEGSYQLNRPLFLDQHQFDPFNNNDFAKLNQLSPVDLSSAAAAEPPETYINLFITLNPPVAPLSNCVPNMYLPAAESYESRPVFEYAKLWEQTLARLWQTATSQSGALASAGEGNRLISRKAHRHQARGSRTARHVRALVLQKDAKYCLITRLLGPLKPPEELLRAAAGGELLPEDEIISGICRFVSLIKPVKHEFISLKSLSSSIWFDSRQLVERWLGGECEEKSMLLCNFLLWLGLPSALLLGDSIPDGRCVYVITWREQTRPFQLQQDGSIERLAEPIGRENFLSRLPIVMNWRSIQLFDANLGKAYSLGERGLPLSSVGSIVTTENVYANIQVKDSPWPANEVQFDVRVRSNWLPLFMDQPSGGGGGSSSRSNQQLTRLFRAASRQGGGRSSPSARRGNQQLLSRLDSLRKSLPSGSAPDWQPIVADPLALEPAYRVAFTRDECKKLEQQLEKSIKAHLLKWRPNKPTYFNRTLSRLLAEKLASFEDHLLCRRPAIDQQDQEPQPQQQQDWRSRLAEVIRSEILQIHSLQSNQSRQVFSWPVNMAYSSMKCLLNSLFASGVHAADMMTMLDESTSAAGANNSTQFFVACHVRAYPARVLSLWLYVGAVVINRRRPA